MNKKIVGIIIGILIFLVIGVLFFFFINHKKLESNDKKDSSDASETTNQETSNQKGVDGNILVVYFSAQNHTKEVAKGIASKLGADTFEIVPKEKYSTNDLDWTDDKSRVSKEHDDENLQNIELTTTKVDNWDSYDTILIGYPIWWGVAAWPVNTFVKDNDFSGKTVIPFCTSASSGLGESGKLLEEESQSGNWSNGQRFSSNPSDSDIQKFVDTIQK